MVDKARERFPQIARSKFYILPCMPCFAGPSPRQSHAIPHPRLRVLAALLVLLLHSPSATAQPRVITSEIVPCIFRPPLSPRPPSSPPPSPEPLAPPAAGGRSSAGEAQESPAGRRLVQDFEEEGVPGPPAIRAKELKCDEKVSMLVELRPDDARWQGEMELTCVGTPNGACPCPCNYLSDPGCSCRDLEIPLKINITQLAFQMELNVDPRGQYRWKAEERVTHNNDCKPSQECFCCQCSRDTNSQEDPTIPGATTRAYGACPVQSGGPYITRHCYAVADETPFQAFLVMDSGVFRSETNVRLQTYRASDFHNEDVVAAMRAGSREHQKNYTLVGAVSVQIVTNYTSPQWRGKLLVTGPGWSQHDKWMLVDSSFFPAHGSSQTACNRVDTLPQNFINQADGCRRAPTQCLRGQLGFLYDQDNAMRDAGKPTYMLSKWTKYAANVKRLPAPTDLYPKQQKLFVPLAVPRDTPVYLRLEFSKAFSNGFTSRHPQGVLTNLTFCATNTESCGKPEIGEARWWLHGNISNLGVTGAQYSLEATCSPQIKDFGKIDYGVNAKETQPLSIMPIRFIADNFGTPEFYQELTAGNCTLLLTDSDGGVMQRVEVPFVSASSAEQFETFVQAEVQARDPCASCNPADSKCLVANTCAGQLLILFGPMAAGIVAVPLVAAALLILAWIFWDVLYPGEQSDESQAPQQQPVKPPWMEGVDLDNLALSHPPWWPPGGNSSGGHRKRSSSGSSSADG